MSSESPKIDPFIKTESYAPMFEKEKSRPSKLKQSRIDVLEHFSKKEKDRSLPANNQSFFVRAMQVPHFRLGITKKIFQHYYVEVNIPTGASEGGKPMKVALNINSLAKRLGLTPQEVRDAGGKINELIEERAALISSHKKVIEQFEIQTGEIVYKEEAGSEPQAGISQPRESFAKGLTPRTFLKVLETAQKHMATHQDKAEFDPVIKVDVEGQQKEFVVGPVPKEKRTDSNPLGHYIFSTDVAKVLGKGSFGRVVRLKEVARRHFAFKHAKSDLPDAEREIATKSVREEALIGTKLHEKEDPKEDTSYLQSPPLFQAKTIQFNIDGEKVEGFFTEECQADLLNATRYETDVGNRHQFCLQLGDMLAKAPSRVVHLDLKPANILINDQGKLQIADFGTANKVKKTEGYIPPLAKGQVGATPGYITKREHLQISLTASEWQHQWNSQEDLPENQRTLPKPKYVDQVLEWGKKCDQFAMGIMMYESYVKTYPYDREKETGSDGREAYTFPIPPEGDKEVWKENHVKILTENGCDKDLAKLIVKLIDLDPEKRISHEDFGKEWAQLRPTIESQATPIETFKGTLKKQPFADEIIETVI